VKSRIRSAGPPRWTEAGPVLRWPRATKEARMFRTIVAGCNGRARGRERDAALDQVAAD
jgi:hypothetical protein